MYSGCYSNKENSDQLDLGLELMNQSRSKLGRLKRKACSEVYDDYGMDCNEFFGGSCVPRLKTPRVSLGFADDGTIQNEREIFASKQLPAQFGFEAEATAELWNHNEYRYKDGCMYNDKEAVEVFQLSQSGNLSQNDLCVHNVKGNVYGPGISQSVLSPKEILMCTEIQSALISDRHKFLTDGCILPKQMPITDVELCNYTCTDVVEWKPKPSFHFSEPSFLPGWLENPSSGICTTDNENEKNDSGVDSETDEEEAMEIE